MQRFEPFVDIDLALLVWLQLERREYCDAVECTLHKALNAKLFWYSRRLSIPEPLQSEAMRFTPQMQGFRCSSPSS